MYVQQTNVGMLWCVGAALASVELTSTRPACLHGTDRDNITFTFYHGELTAETFTEMFVVLYGHLQE